MMCEETIKVLIDVADEALFACKDTHLTPVQRLILEESLLGNKYERMTGYSPSHLKNQGAELWQLLSEALGEPISKLNFRAALERRASPSAASNSLAIEFSQLLSTEEKPSIICLFLKNNPKIIRNVFNINKNSYVFYYCSLPNLTLDICVGKSIPTMGRWEWSIVFLGLVSGDLHKSIKSNLLKIKTLRRLCNENIDVIRANLPGFQANFFCHIVTGQREFLSQETRKEIQSINDYEVGIRVRTYDWFLDEAETSFF